MAELTRQQRTTLRMATARTFSVRLRDPQVRAQFLESGWVQGSTVIPCESDTPFEEVQSVIDRRIERGEASFVVVVLSLTGDLMVTTLVALPQEKDSFWAMQLSEIHPHVTMGDVVNALRPDKKWDIAELTEVERESFTQLLVAE